VLVPQGVGVRRAAAGGVFSSLPQPLVAVPAFVFGALFDGLVPAGLGFAGGAMVWMVVAQVVPSALESASRRSVTIAFAVSALAMLALEALLLA
jgi:ZIP family zinc transporter